MFSCIWGKILNILIYFLFIVKRLLNTKQSLDSRMFVSFTPPHSDDNDVDDDDDDDDYDDKG